MGVVGSGPTCGVWQDESLRPENLIVIRAGFWPESSPAPVQEICWKHMRTIVS